MSRPRPRPPASRGGGGPLGLAITAALVVAAHALLLAAAWRTLQAPRDGQAMSPLALDVRQIRALAPETPLVRPAVTPSNARAPAEPGRAGEVRSGGSAAGAKAEVRAEVRAEARVESRRHARAEVTAEVRAARAAPATTGRVADTVRGTMDEVTGESSLSAERNAAPAPAAADPLPGLWMGNEVDGAAGGPEAATAEQSPAPPIYATQPPPSATLHYALYRGSTTSEAALSWQLGADGRYAIDLRVGMAVVDPSPPGSAAIPPAAVPASGPRRQRAAAPAAPHWRSEGRLDATGVAPERFAVARRGRERHAANFQRDAGLITFSGPSRTYPLWAGAQDRLSWIVQLAAVLQADPSLLATGVPLSLMVVGAHGDAAPWRFVNLGATSRLGPGDERFLVWHLRREALHAHDAHVEVWLAPALQHWPVAMIMARASGGESTEWRLRALRSSP